jgi:glycosyltransferase involved in cell wall biosynthesis
MKILHVLPSLDQMYGGPLRAVVDLSVHSQEFGLESEIVGVGPFRMGDCKLRREAIHSLPLSAPRMYRFSRELKPWLDKNLERYDGAIIHGLWLYINWATHSSCQASSTKYACFPHGMLEPWPVHGQGVLKRLKKNVYWHAREKRIFDRAQSIFFTTEREKTLAGSTFHLSTNHHIVVPYGVADAPPDADRTAPAKFNLPAGSKGVLFLGRLHRKKNVHFLIDTWAKAALPSDWHLVIAGPAEQNYLEYLRHLAASAPLPNNIHFVGPVVGSEKTYLFRRCSWFLLPSQQENFGIAVLEAISHGCPVAISDQVYLADALHEQSEIMPLRQEAWIEFMQTRMQDESWRATIRQKDREAVVPRFAIRNVAKAWAETLTSVFSGASARPLPERIAAKPH